MKRKFRKPWRVEALDGGYVVVDNNGFRKARAILLPKYPAKDLIGISIEAAPVTEHDSFRLP